MLCLLAQFGQLIDTIFHRSITCRYADVNDLLFLGCSAWPGRQETSPGFRSLNHSLRGWEPASLSSCMLRTQSLTITAIARDPCCATSRAAGRSPCSYDSMCPSSLSWVCRWRTSVAKRPGLRFDLQNLPQSLFPFNLKHVMLLQP